MSKLYVSCVVVALLALMVVPAMAAGGPNYGPPGQLVDASVSLTIEKWCKIASLPWIDLTATSVEGTCSGSAHFHWAANFTYDVDGELVWTGPGNLVFTKSSLATANFASNQPPGAGFDMVSVTHSGLTYYDTAGDYPDAGTVTLTISEYTL